MRIFSESVDKRSREAMTSFLARHFRYNTMKSWNNAKSFACNMKIYNLGLESEISNKLYDLIQTEEFYEPISDLIYNFGAAHNFEWQAGFNGRSGGYLVLYQGGQKPSGYKSYCTQCGQKNYKSTADNGCACGRCGKNARKDFTQTHMSVYTLPGRSVDAEGLDMDSLRDMVEIVCDFDKLADDIVAEAVYMARNYEAVEEIIYVPQTRRVLQEVSA